MISGGFWKFDMNENLIRLTHHQQLFLVKMHVSCWEAVERTIIEVAMSLSEFVIADFSKRNRLLNVLEMIVSVALTGIAYARA